jgi:hypothetical protein
MKRLLATLGLFLLAVAGLAAANAIMLAIVAALDIAPGVPPQMSAIPALAALAAALALVAARKGSRATEPEVDSSQSTSAVECPRAIFLSSIVIRRRQNQSATRKERSIYSETSF